MKKLITVFLALFLSLSVFSAPVFAASKFNDVTTKTSGYKQIMWASATGIVNGFNDGTFRPDDNCTRAQLAVMLWRLKGEPSVSGSNPFPDVGSYSGNVQKAITWVYKMGIVSGFDDGTYRPDDNVTRQQMAIMLWRMAGQPTVSTSSLPFSDISGCSPGVKKAIVWAAKMGISMGSNGKFDPKGDCTRAQLAIFLYRYHYKLDFNDYSYEELNVLLPNNMEFTKYDPEEGFDFEYWGEKGSKTVLVYGFQLKKSDVTDEYSNLTVRSFSEIMLEDSEYKVLYELKNLLIVSENLEADGDRYYFINAYYVTDSAYYVVYYQRDSSSTFTDKEFLDWAIAIGA